MRPRWVGVLQIATGLLWLAVGVSGLARGDAGFIPVVATIAGAAGLLAAWLYHRRT